MSRIKVGAGAMLVLLSLIFVERSDVFLIYGISAVLHEMGHLLAAKRRKIKIKEIRIGISGARICIEAGFDNPFLIIVMGMLSGTGGSMTRDIIMREVPALLRKHIYLMAALAGATIYYLLVRFGVSDMFAVPIGAILIVIVRILATVFKWNMPKAIDFKSLWEKSEKNK